MSKGTCLWKLGVVSIAAMSFSSRSIKKILSGAKIASSKARMNMANSNIENGACVECNKTIFYYAGEPREWCDNCIEIDYSDFWLNLELSLSKELGTQKKEERGYYA